MAARTAARYSVARPTTGAPAGNTGQDPLSDARTRILDAAAELLAEHGLRSLTQPRVCKKSGLRQSHLTYYFPTRRDLMIGVAQRSMETLSQPLLAKASTGRLNAATLARTLGKELADRSRVRIMIGLISAAEDDPVIADALCDLITRIRGKLSALFKALEIPHDTDSVALAHALLVGTAMLHHARVNADARREVGLASQFIVNRLPMLHTRSSTRKVGKTPIRKARK